MFAQFLQASLTEDSPQLESSQYNTGVTQYSCSQLSHTIFSQTESLMLCLFSLSTNYYVPNTLSNDKTLYSQWKAFYNTSALESLTDINYPVYVNTSLLPCAAGFMHTTGPSFKCVCSELYTATEEDPLLHPRRGHRPQWIGMGWYDRRVQWN